MTITLIKYHCSLSQTILHCQVDAIQQTSQGCKGYRGRPLCQCNCVGCTCKLFGLGSVMLDVFKEEAYMSDKVRPVPGSALLGAWPAP